MYADLPTRLAVAFRERAGAPNEPLPPAEDVTRILTGQCGLEGNAATALAEGDEWPALTLAQVGGIATALNMDPDLLACVLIATSAEGIHHVIAQLPDESFASEQCEDCAELATRRELADHTDDLDELVELAVDLLCHLPNRRRAAADPFDELEVDEEQGPAHDLDELVSLMAELDPEARARVVDYAHQEYAHAYSADAFGRSGGALAAHAHLRANYLAPLAVESLDVLADAPGGRLALAELADRVGVDRQAIELHLSDLVRDGVSMTMNDGYDFEAPPLHIDLSSAPATAVMSANSRAAWSALRSADADGRHRRQ